MTVEQAATHPEVGSFEIEVHRPGREGRSCCSRFKLRCDAIGLHEKEILLLSVVGPETAVKAVTAGLRSSDWDQQRIGYSVRLGDLDETHLTKSPSGYRVYRAKPDSDLWHVLCLARRDGFLPVVADETVWQLLRGDRFATPVIREPVIREWVPWLSGEMTKRGLLVPLTQVGCRSGLVTLDGDTLDDLVCDGVRKRHLTIRSQPAGEVGGNGATEPGEVESLEDYLSAYGPLLGRQAERALDPLYVPGR